MKNHLAKGVGIGMLVGSLLLTAGCGKTEAEETASVKEILPEVTAEAIPTEESVQEEAAIAVSSEEEEPEVVEEPEPEVISFTISAAGDCSLGNYFGEDYNRSFNQVYAQEQNPAYFFENVVDLFEQDSMTIVNLEGVLTTSDEKTAGRTYNIKGDPSYVEILTAGNVEAVSMANNHRLDYGEKGTQDTLAALEPTGIVYAYDENTGMYERDGVKVGIVSVNAIHQSNVVEKNLKNGIEALREQGADLVFACCHWGIERDHYPNSYQQTLAHQIIDWGADLVIGHHPHVLQGIEEYQGKYIIYSLGNFSFGANRNPSDKDTMIFRQTFTFVDGELQTEAPAKVIPCCLSSVKDRNDYKPTPSEGDEKAKIIKRLNDYSKNMKIFIDEDGFITSNNAFETVSGD